MVDTLREKIINSIKIPQLMAMATVTGEGKPWVRYVMGFGSENLEIRVVTGLQSRKVMHIKNNPEIHLICGASTLDATKYYLQICAEAEVTTKKEEKDRCWNDNLKAYFSGPDDPDYCIIIVKPYRIEYSSMTNMKPEVWEVDS